MTRLFQRVGEQGRAVVRLEIDAVPVTALEGDTPLVAILTNGARLRESEFGDGPRACPACSAHSASAGTGSCWAPASERARSRRSRQAPGVPIEPFHVARFARTGASGRKEAAG